MRHSRSPFLFFCCAALFDIAQSFNFTVHEQPTQCDPLSLTWTGGQPPFRLIIILPELVNINMSIPDTNFQDNKGSFIIPALPVPRTTQVFFGMSDATGAVSGGTTSLMTVGDPLAGQSCNTTTPAADISFSTLNTLTQCSDFLFIELPLEEDLTIFAFIPGGSDSFIVPRPKFFATSINWKANITAQTQVTFSVTDALERNSKTEKLRVVAPSNDESCLLKTGSSTTTGSSSTTGSSTTTTSSTTTSSLSTSQSPSTPTSGSNQSQSRGGLPTGAIIGIAVGGAGVVAVLIVLCWLGKRLKSRSYDGRSINLAEGFSQDSEMPQPILSQQYAPIPYPLTSMHQSMNSSVASFRPEQPQYPPPPHSQYDSGSSSSFGAATRSGSSSRQNFVVHRDIEEARGPTDLPPQYNEHRAPIPNLNQDPPPWIGGEAKN